MNDSTVREPAPLDLAELDRRKRYLYCTARPGDDVPPTALPLLSLTFWADPVAPRDRVRYRVVVTAAARLLRAQEPWATPSALRREARRRVRELLALPDSPIVLTHAEWERRHA